jgi:polyisoprenoid-binding protein YceI
MRFQRAWFALFLAVSLISTPALAEVLYDLDKPHTRIGFSVRHIVVSYVQGDFKAFNGHFKMKDGVLTHVEAVIETASIDTANQKRDDHLRSPDFLDVGKFPEMKFVSKRITHNGNKYTVVGDLTIKDVTKPVTLEGELVGMVDKGLDEKPHAGFYAEGKINRKDFNVNFHLLLEGGGLVVGDEVKIVLDVDGAAAS